MNVSISKSVGRAFEVMELFREWRRPATATEIRKHLDCPHSSVVAVLHNLASIGYLSYNRSTRLYFPTARFGTLANWVQPALKASGRLRELVGLIALETGQTTAIACRSSVLLNIVHVATGSHGAAIKFASGIGFVLCRSIPGLALMSQLPDDQVEQIVSQTERWIERAQMGEHVELAKVMQAVARTRRDGRLISLSSSIKNVGAVAYPLSSPFDGSPLAIAVSGPSQKIETDSALICQIMEHYLCLHARRTGEVWPRFGHDGRGIGCGFSSMQAMNASLPTQSRPHAHAALLPVG